MFHLRWIGTVYKINFSFRGYYGLAFDPVLYSNNKEEEQKWGIEVLMFIDK